MKVERINVRRADVHVTSSFRQVAIRINFNDSAKAHKLRERIKLALIEDAVELHIAGAPQRRS